MQWHPLSKDSACALPLRAGSNYLATKPGGYRLEFGGMHEIRGDAVMLIADLDDAVFGDDRTCSEFKQVWERNFRLRGSCLVYNTDRALDKWLSLWRERALRLAAPDVLIASAGTKVYHAAPDVSLRIPGSRTHIRSTSTMQQRRAVRHAAPDHNE